MSLFPHWLRPSALRWCSNEAERNEEREQLRLHTLKVARQNTKDPFRGMYDRLTEQCEASIRIHRHYRFRWRNIATRLDRNTGGCAER